MRKYIISACLALVGCATAFAAEQIPDSEGNENYLYCNSGQYMPEWVAINAQTNQGKLMVYLDNETDDFNSFMFKIFLPEGFTIASTTFGQTKLYDITLNNTGSISYSKMYNHTFAVGDHSDEGYYTILCYSPNAIPIRANDDLLMTITIQAPDGYRQEDDAVEATIEEIEFTQTSNYKTHYLASTPFTIMSEQLVSSVESVTYDGIYPEGVYDLYGRKIKADGYLAPGFYIIDGVKTHVK